MMCWMSVYQAKRIKELSEKQLAERLKQVQQNDHSYYAYKCKGCGMKGSNDDICIHCGKPRGDEDLV